MSDADHGIIRAPNGNFLPGTGKATRFTSETARAAAHKRHDDAEKAARLALVRRYNEGGVNPTHTAPGVWGEMVAAIGVGTVANAMERPHDAARAAAFVGRATGLLRPVEPGRDMPATGAVLQLSEAAAEYIGRVLVQAAAAGREADTDA